MQWYKSEFLTIFWILITFRRMFAAFHYKIAALIWLLGCFFKHILGTTIRAFCLTGLLDRQIHLRMRIPQIHARHGTGQRYIPALHLVTVLRVRCNQILVNGSCSFCHGSHRNVC